MKREFMSDLEEFLKNVLAEDVGRGDLFSKVSEPHQIEGKIVAKSAGVLSGEIYINRLAKMENFKIEWFFHDGDCFKRGDVILRVYGDSHTILRVERTILNIVLHSSSIATLTREFVHKIDQYGVKLLDTRKTRPLLRSLEKYSTKVGGATNHRMGLDDSLMLKDTHLKAIKDLDSFLSMARTEIPFTTKIEIECETVEFAKEVLLKDIDIVMCDNMRPEEIAEVVKFRNEHSPRVLLEASGNIKLSNIEDYAKSGVDAISVGSIIHQANWIDLSMKIE
jgi:nicotinate-nucleotide pyrophosphorylase (carboxylating)